MEDTIGLRWDMKYEIQKWRVMWNKEMLTMTSCCWFFRNRKICEVTLKEYLWLNTYSTGSQTVTGNVLQINVIPMICLLNHILELWLNLISCSQVSAYTCQYDVNAFHFCSWILKKKKCFITFSVSYGDD